MGALRYVCLLIVPMAATGARAQNGAEVKARMGWEMSCYTTDRSFDKDFGVDEWHGHNVFFRDGDTVFRTYFINNRTRRWGPPGATSI